MLLRRGDNSNFWKNIGWLWQEGFAVDLRIACDDGDVTAHKLILASASEKYSQVLKGANEDDELVIVLLGFKKLLVQESFQFLYGIISEGMTPDHVQIWEALGIDYFIWLQDGIASNGSTVKEEINCSTRQNEVDSEFVFIDDYVCDDNEDEDLAEEEDPEAKEPVKRRGRKRKFVKTAEGKWQCILCEQVRENRHSFYGHMKEAHSQSEPPFVNIEQVGFQCIYCKIVVSQKFQFENHLCFANGPNYSHFKSNAFRCAGCFSTFNVKTCLVDHLVTCEVGRNSTFYCKMCDKLFYDTESKIFHEMEHAGAFKCSTCDQQFPGGSLDYLQHWATVHCGNDRNLAADKHHRADNKKSSFSCSLCDKVFNCKSSLFYHTQKHATPFFDCNRCPKRFKSMKGLLYHQNIHDGRTDFLCDDCGRGFVTNQKLVNHRRAKHTFERPFVCEHCSRGFTRSDKLQVHKRRAHTFEKPYECPTQGCDWRGVDSSSLIHHRRRHEPKP